MEDIILKEHILGLPDGACLLAGKACEMHHNAVTGQQGVETLEECRTICKADNCTYLTYYGASSFLLPQTCVTFSACEVLNNCTDCFTEDGACTACSSRIETSIHETLVDFIPDIETEASCSEACKMNTDCRFYTHYGLADPAFPGTCFLISALEGPIRACSHCQTGARNCSDPSGCLLVTDQGVMDDMDQGLLITTSSTVLSSDYFGGNGRWRKWRWRWRRQRPC